MTPEEQIKHLQDRVVQLEESGREIVKSNRRAWEAVQDAGRTIKNLEVHIERLEADLSRAERTARVCEHLLDIRAPKEGHEAEIRRIVEESVAECRADWDPSELGENYAVLLTIFNDVLDEFIEVRRQLEIALGWKRGELRSYWGCALDVPDRIRDDLLTVLDKPHKLLSILKDSAPENPWVPLEDAPKVERDQYYLTLTHWGAVPEALCFIQHEKLPEGAWFGADGETRQPKYIYRPDLGPIPVESFI